MDRVTTTIEGLFLGYRLIAIGIPLILFGILAGYLAGMRDRLLLVAATVPTTVGLLVVSHQVLGAIDVELALVPIAVIALLPALAVGLARREYARRRPATGSVPLLPQAPWPIWIGAGCGALLSAAAWLPGIGKGSLPPQANDDIWHGYLTARLADLQSVTAGSVAPAFADSVDPTSFYPYGLHLVGATLRAITGVAVPQSLNAIWVMAIGFTLPFGMAALVRALLPHRPWAAAYASVAAVAMPFFPYALNGIMPYALGLSVIPVLLAITVEQVRRGRPGGELALVVGAVGLLVTHPAAAVVFVICAFLIVLEITLSSGQRAVRRTATRLAPLGVAAGLLALPFLASGAEVGSLLPLTRSQIVPSAARAGAMVLTLQTPWTPAQPLMAALVLLGVAALLVRRLPGWSLLISYVVFAALFVGTTTGASWSSALVKPWYGEWYRLAGVVSLLGAFFAGVAGGSLHALAVRLLARREQWLPRLGMAAIALAALAFSLGIARSILGAQSTVSSAWQGPALVTADDVTLFHELANRVGPDEQVLNNWQDGSTWMYAIAGARPAIPYASSVGVEPQWNDVLNGFGTFSPSACRLLVERRVTFAITKKVMVGRGVGTWGPIADTHPAVFKRELSNAAGSIYRLDPAALAECAGR